MPRRTDISSIIVLGAGPILLAAACGTVPAADEALRAERLGQLRDIARTCGLPRSALELRGNDELLFRGSPDTTYEQMGCTIRELEKADFPLKMGFVAEPPPAPRSEMPR